ncbi:MAG: hypothetical protein ACRYG2_21945 [Janthinobacterium lividum]
MITALAVFVAEVVGGVLLVGIAGWVLVLVVCLILPRVWALVRDSHGTGLGEHFDVAHCTFRLEPEGHRAHEPAQHA